MVRFIREYWFGLLLATVVGLFLIFSTIVAVAPHVDREMRGFAPCTFEIATSLSQSERPTFGEVSRAIGRGYGCYFNVMREGWKLYTSHQQNTPWANYLFEPVLDNEFDVDEGESEPISEELEKANMLDEPDEEEWFESDVKENSDDEKNSEE